MDKRLTNSRHILRFTIDHRPSTIDHRPSTIDHRPSTIDHRPVPGMHLAMDTMRA